MVHCCMLQLIAEEQMKERDMDKNFSDSFLTGGIAGEHHLM